MKKFALYSVSVIMLVVFLVNLDILVVCETRPVDPWAKSPTELAPPQYIAGTNPASSTDSSVAAAISHFSLGNNPLKFVHHPTTVTPDTDQELQRRIAETRRVIAEVVKSEAEVASAWIVGSTFYFVTLIVWQVRKRRWHK